MKKNLIALFILTATIVSCQQKDWGIVKESQADTPVTVSNLFGTYTGVPTVATSLSGGGTITITLNIPSSSGRQIKEISRVALGSVPNNYKVIQTTNGLYNTAPVAGSGTSVTFTTSLAEYTAKTGIAVTSGGTDKSFLGKYFYFLVTLDDGTQLMPVPVRVYVNS